MKKCILHNPHLIREVDDQLEYSLNVWSDILGPQIVGSQFFARPLNAEVYEDIFIDRSN